MRNPTTSSVDSISLKRIDSSKYTPSEITTSTIASTTASLLPPSNTFIPNNTLQIQAHGKAPFSAPFPPKELTIPIFSQTTARPVYLSIRPERRSGSCTLVDAEDETRTAIASTVYFLVPGRYPQVRIGREDDLGADTFEVLNKGMFTHAKYFDSRKWGRLEWHYGGRRERAFAAAAAATPSSSGEDSKINNLLVLEKVVCLEGRREEERIKVAQLIRSETTRSPGTSARYAGNGGRLEICSMDEEGKELVDDVTVVVTCLIMLKKEVDRMRARQFAVMAGAGGGA